MAERIKILHLLLLLLALTACSPRTPPPVVTLPVEARELSGGPQSEPTPGLRALVAELLPLPPRERLAAMLQLVSEHFIFDPWQNNSQLGHNADELAAARALGGCGAYALVEVALVRAMGLPARLVLTADADWVSRYRTDGLSMISGHTYIEVLVEGRWWLLDPTFFEIYDTYLPDRPYYPRRQLFVARGLDFDDLGLRTMAHLQTLYDRAASTVRLPWQDPRLTPSFALTVHPPTLLTRAGQFFLDQHRFPEAEERLTKALIQDPDFPAALLTRGQLFFQRREFPAALTDLDRAIRAAPKDPNGYRWRAQARNALGRKEGMCDDLAQACSLGKCADLEWVRGERLCPGGGSQKSAESGGGGDIP